MIGHSTVFNSGDVVVNPDASALTFCLATDPAIVSNADAAAFDADPDAVVLKSEYVIVDAEKQTTRCVVSSRPLEW